MCNSTVSDMEQSVKDKLHAPSWCYYKIGCRMGGKFWKSKTDKMISVIAQCVYCNWHQQRNVTVTEWFVTLNLSVVFTGGEWLKKINLKNMLLVCLKFHNLPYPIYILFDLHHCVNENIREKNYISRHPQTDPIRNKEISLNLQQQSFIPADRFDTLGLWATINRLIRLMFIGNIVNDSYQL